MEQGRPYTERLATDGLIDRLDGTLTIIDSGRTVAERLFETRSEALGRLLTGWQPGDHPELTALLRELAEDSLGSPEDRRLLREEPVVDLG